eukprot:scaffold2506_cov236-Pinguiococcus_pyrenoidosus.AAC.3
MLLGVRLRCSRVTHGRVRCLPSSVEDGGGRGRTSVGMGKAQDRRHAALKTCSGDGGFQVVPHPALTRLHDEASAGLRREGRILLTHGANCSMYTMGAHHGRPPSDDTHITEGPTPEEGAVALKHDAVVCVDA